MDFRSLQLFTHLATSLHFGDTAKAMELGWQPPAEVPQWQQHQMQQEQAQQEAIPTMFSLDDM